MPRFRCQEGLQRALKVEAGFDILPMSYSQTICGLLAHNNRGFVHTPVFCRIQMRYGAKNTE